MVKKKKNSLANAGDIRDMDFIPGPGRSSGVGNGNPLQYSCLGNPVDRGAWAGCSSQGRKESDTTEHNTAAALTCTQRHG